MVKMILAHLSFPVLHKVGNIGIFVLPLLWKWDGYMVIIYFNFNSKHHDKCKFVLTFIPLVTTSSLFPLEVVQKRQLANFVYYRKTRI